MAYLSPAEFVTKMVDTGEAKIHMSTRDTLIRAFMAGALAALTNKAPQEQMLAECIDFALSIGREPTRP